jgi:hypothetical protein
LRIKCMCICVCFFGQQRYIDDREREIEIPKNMFDQIYIKIYARMHAW